MVLTFAQHWCPGYHVAAVGDKVACGRPGFCAFPGGHSWGYGNTDSVEDNPNALPISILCPSKRLTFLSRYYKFHE